MSAGEHPIIFSGPMVTAILRGEKSQTRRIVKPQQAHEPGAVWVRSGDMHAQCRDELARGVMDAVAEPIRCPFGQPGDRLWVRETWTALGNEDGHPIDETGELCAFRDAALRYRADAVPVSYGLERLPDGGDYDGPWRSPIHMPRWASRLTLEIVSVRVERLQDITEDDTDAEVFGGDYPHTVRPDLFPDFEAAGALSMQECFARVWDDINGKKPGRAWADNPWTWVIEFEQVTP